MKLEHLKFCEREKYESLVDYFKHFHMLSSQLETLDMKETTKICTMNVGLASWFPSGSLFA